MRGNVRMITAVPDVDAGTVIYNALHFAYHNGYLSELEVLRAFSAFGAEIPETNYKVFYQAWAQRHGLPARQGEAG